MHATANIPGLLHIVSHVYPSTGSGGVVIILIGLGLDHIHAHLKSLESIQLPTYHMDEGRGGVGWDEGAPRKLKLSYQKRKPHRKTSTKIFW